jgi:hypothetical protein
VATVMSSLPGTPAVRLGHRPIMRDLAG